MKRVFKTIAIIGALVAIFAAGWCGSSFRDFMKSFGKPHVQSDDTVRAQIIALLPSIPETSHHLYYSSEGFADVNRFIAFSVQKIDFSSSLAHVRELASLRGQGAPKFTGDPIRLGPDSHKNPLWDLSQYSDLITETTNVTTMMYSPSKYRIFVCIWGY